MKKLVVKVIVRGPIKHLVRIVGLLVAYTIVRDLLARFLA
jgi:hypothetical protein